MHHIYIYIGVITTIKRRRNGWWWVVFLSDAHACGSTGGTSSELLQQQFPLAVPMVTMDWFSCQGLGEEDKASLGDLCDDIGTSSIVSYSEELHT